MTWSDLVRKYFPTATDRDADFVLWEHTCFPMGSAEDVEEQLKAIAKRGGTPWPEE